MPFIIKYADADGSALDFEDDADNPKRAKLRAKGGIEKGGAARAEVYDEDSGKMVLVCKDKGGKAVCSKPGSGKSASESGELREARRRIKLLEQENEVLRRAAAYLSQANLPGKGSTRS